jgi:hypothetical protein
VHVVEVKAMTMDEAAMPVIQAADNASQYRHAFERQPTITKTPR